MPRRINPPSERYFHVSHYGNRRAPLFARPKDYREFLAILGEGLRRLPVPIIAYCVMDSRWQLVAGPTGISRLARLMRWVATTHAGSVASRARLGRHDPDRGCTSCCGLAGADELLRACRDVERCALASHLVRRAQDWPWTSLADRQRSHTAIPLAAAEFLASDAWLRHVNTDYASDLGDDAKLPGRLARGSKAGDDVVHIAPRTGQHEPHTHVEGPKHLRLVQLARTPQPLEYWRHDPARAIDSEVATLGEHARNVLGDSASGNVRHPLDPAPVDERQNRGEVGAMRAKQRLPDRLAKFGNVAVRRERKDVEGNPPGQ